MYFDRITSTVCALATAKGSSIGVIRVSGTKAFEIAAAITRRKTFEHRKVGFVKIFDGEKVDYCKDMLKKAEEKGVKILLPIDCKIAKNFPDPIFRSCIRK